MGPGASASSDCVHFHNPGGAKPQAKARPLHSRRVQYIGGNAQRLPPDGEKKIRVLFEFHLQVHQLHHMISGTGLAIQSWPTVWQRSHFCKSGFLLCSWDIILGKVPLFAKGQCPGEGQAQLLLHKYPRAEGSELSLEWQILHPWQLSRVICRGQ